MKTEKPTPIETTQTEPERSGGSVQRVVRSASGPIHEDKLQVEREWYQLNDCLNELLKIVIPESHWKEAMAETQSWKIEQLRTALYHSKFAKSFYNQCD